MKPRFVAFDQSGEYICILSKQNNLECFKTISKNYISFCKKDLMVEKKNFHIELRSFFPNSFKKFHTKPFIGFRVFLFFPNNIYVVSTNTKSWINVQMKKRLNSFGTSGSEIYILSNHNLFIFDIDSGEILKKINVRYFIKTINDYLITKISKNNQYLFFQTEPLVLISLDFGYVLQYLQSKTRKQFAVSFLNSSSLILLFEKNFLKIWNFKKKKIKKINLFSSFRKIQIKGLKKIFIKKQFFLAFFSKKLFFLCSLKKYNNSFNMKIKVLFLIKFYKKIWSIRVSDENCLFFIISFNKKKYIPIKLSLKDLKFPSNNHIFLSRIEHEYKLNTYYMHLLFNNFKNFFKTNLYVVTKMAIKNTLQFINIKFKTEKKYFIKTKKTDSGLSLNVLSFLTTTKEFANLKQLLKINKNYNSKLTMVSDKFYILPLVVLLIQEILHVNRKKEYYFSYINYIIFYYFSCLTKENFLKYFLNRTRSSKNSFIAKEILHNLLFKMSTVKKQNEKYISPGFVSL